MKYIDLSASIIGYIIIVVLAIFIIFLLYQFLYRFSKAKFYKSRLWWEIHTIKVYYLKLDKMHNVPYKLVRHREIIERDCPEDLKSIWVNKINLKLEELRKEIISHGETPSF